MLSVLFLQMNPQWLTPACEMTKMTTSTDSSEEKYFPALALALLEEPRASLQELAKAARISKATLYRFCRTRDELVDRLFCHCRYVFTSIITGANLVEAPIEDALTRLTTSYLEHNELSSFLLYYWKDLSDPEIADAWYMAIDAFFLRGQREGVFRLDIPSPALTEMWFAIMSGMADAERRGRIARAGLPSLIRRAFMHGVAA